MGIKIGSTRKALQIIKDYPDIIINGNQLGHIKGIGPKCIKNINEIVSTGLLEKCKNVVLSSNTILNNLEKITGVGPIKALKLYKMGQTLEKLLNTTVGVTLTHHQLMGIKYFNDIEQRIPHSEIIEISTYLNNIISEVCPNLHIIICGSFRRNVSTSGDIDILVYHDNIITQYEASKTEYLNKFKTILINNGFLVDNLTLNGNTKYMGFGKYGNNPVRRIDIRFIPTESIGAAKLYFTGCGEFNKRMRSFAISKGYTINEYGIYNFHNKMKGDIIKTKTETDIFNLLGLDYIEPVNRLQSYNFI
jgi:DNA polymerase/3'-5' exonuclease PolX